MTLSIRAKERKVFKKRIKSLREKGVLPAVLYGPEIKNLNLEIGLKEFERLYKEAGESSLIKLEIKGGEEKNKEVEVLIHDVQRSPLTEQIIHVDFYHPSLKEKTEAVVPIVFEGEAPAVKEMGGTLIKNISEIEVRALPKDLPKEIKVNVGNLRTFEDDITVKDLLVPPSVEILKGKEEIIAYLAEPEKIEEELEKSIEEKVEEVEKVEVRKEKAETTEEG